MGMPSHHCAVPSNSDFPRQGIYLVHPDITGVASKWGESWGKSWGKSGEGWG